MSKIVRITEGSKTDQVLKKYRANRKTSLQSKDEVSTWLDDAKSAITAMEDYNTKNANVYDVDYGGDAGKKINDLLNASNDVYSYLVKHKDEFEDYDNYLYEVNNYRSALQQMDLANYKTSMYYGQFKDAGDYEYQKNLADIMNMSADEVKKRYEDNEYGVAITSPEGNNITWKDLYNEKVVYGDFQNQYNQYSALPDWQTNSKSINFSNDAAILEELNKTLMPYEKDIALSSGYSEQEFNDIDKKRKYINDKYGVDLFYDIYDNTNVINNLEHFLSFEKELTNEEREYFSYLYNTQGASAAMAWMESMEEPFLKKRELESYRKYVTELGNEHPILGAIGSLATNQAASIEATLNALNYFETGELEQNTMAIATNGLRGGLSNAVDLNIGNFDAFDFVYNSAMSRLDSAISGLMFGKLAGVPLGLSAAAQAANGALERGASADNAFWTGVTAGIAEGLFESLSLGSLKSFQAADVVVKKDIAKNIAKQIFVEGSEEFLTEVANTVMDRVINKELSQVDTDYRKYLAQGMTEEEAKRKVRQDVNARIAEAGASGMLMGIMGGAPTAIGQSIGLSNRNKMLGYGVMASGGKDQLMQLALETAGATKGGTARNLQTLTKKVEAKPTAQRVGNLAVQTKLAQDKVKRNELQIELMKQGLTKKEAATAVKEMYGEEMESKKEDTLAKSAKVQEAINAVKAETAKTTTENAEANQNTEIEVNNDESKNGISVRNGSERDGGTNSERSVRFMEESAERNQVWKGGGRAADSAANRLVDAGREVSSAEIGLLNGSKTHKVVSLDESQDTKEMRKARKRAEKRGLKVRFFVGDNLVMYDDKGNEISVRGYIRGDVVLVRADHPYYTADQIMRHELGHDMIEKGEVNVDDVRKRLLEIVGEEGINALAKQYAEAYEGSKMTAEEIWEECICDSLGDMNVFSSDESAHVLMANAMKDIKKAVGETKAGKTSREVDNANAEEYNGRTSIETKRKRIVPPRNDYATYAMQWAHSKKTEIGEQKLFYRRGMWVLLEKTDDGFVEIKSYTDKQRKNIIKEIEVYNETIRKDLYTCIMRHETVGEHDLRYNGDDGRKQTGNGRTGSIHQGESESNRSTSDEEGFNDSWDNESGITKENEESDFSSPEEAKTSGKISDAKFSIEFADDIANKQRKYAKDGLSMISAEEIEKAIADTAHMVKEMKPYANILPQDKVGKTLVKNGSYDVSVENTTVFIRTLAYNSFVDMVSEKVGRPLTQMESFLVSQKLYEIAKEPQCLYCYVSLDRKAFNEMVIRYVEQRNNAIEAYKEAGEPKIPSSMDANWSLFKEFLNGRKATTNMWDRYVGWLKAYKSGERLVDLSDISTEAKRLELVESGGGMASQVTDILKYAQSASWAKKQTQYVAYYDEILKLKPSVIRNLNSHYGMRWYSFSDYSGAFIVENMQQVTDAAIRGLKGLSYTKDTDFAEIFAPTGMNINISVYAMKTENGYKIDEKQSANLEEAIRLRNKYPNVGIVVVATDKQGVEWALSQKWSDVVIPFHTVRTGADVAEFYNWEIFNNEQSDTVTDQNLWDAYVNEVGKKKASKNVYPSEHQNNKDTYLAICKERGLTPRFNSFIDNPNYMKLVNETRQSEGDTTPLKAKFDVSAAERSFDKFVEKGGYYEGWYNDGVDVDGEAEIVAEDVRSGRKANEVDYGRQDVNFEDIAKGRKSTREHGHTSRELDTIDYMDEQAEKEGTKRATTKAWTNRELLANALESVAQTDEERKKLKTYKERIDILDKQQKSLDELRDGIEKEYRKKRSERDYSKIKELKEKANKLADQITNSDKMLLKLEATEALKGVLQREKQRSYAEAAKRGREAMHKNVVGRHKTEVKHKIQRVARDLDKLLNRATKERNVKKGETTLVQKALELNDMLFVTDEELLINGIQTDYTKAEENAMEKYLDLYDEYHSYDDAVTENKEKRKELRSEMNEVKKELEGLLERERNRISQAKAEGLYDAVAKEYEALRSSKDPFIANAFDQEKLDHINALKDNVGKDTLVKDMTLEQLENLYKAFRMIQKTIINSNQLFDKSLKETAEEAGVNTVHEVEAHGHKKEFSVFEKAANALGWNNLKPIYLMERIGSKTLKKLFQLVLDAESNWATYSEEANKFREEQQKKFNFDQWDLKKKHKFDNGNYKFELTLDQMLTIYAYYKRGDVALNHLQGSGFVFDKMKYTKMGIPFELNDKTAYVVTDAILAEIIGDPSTGEKGILTDDQKGYVEAIQQYLSKDLGARGNEVSNKLYGFDLFNEEYYISMRSEGVYMEKVRNKGKVTPKITNRGFTKPLTNNAKNPLVLSTFGDLWSSHVIEMNEYAAFALALHDMDKVLNYNVKDSAGNIVTGVRTAIQHAYGEEAVKAIDQLMEDLNGGARTDYRENIAKKAVAAFKKAKVMLSLSVIVQQPSAIVRAQAMINPKYFVGKRLDKAKHKELWNELKEHAPVAIIKEMGGYDVGMGKTTQKWIMGDETFMDKVDSITSRGAAYADEVTWLAIWDAVKRETLHNNKKMSPTSKEFLDLAGKRFEDVIRRTQVYDSTLSRSAYMRSKSLYMQMSTAFLAEPTTSINMLGMAIKSGDKKTIARVFTAVHASYLLNAILVALPYAMRDDDEDETFVEKYLSSLMSSFVNNANPLTSIPFIKDIWSLLQGYDIERADMSLASDLVDGFKTILLESTKEEPNTDKVIAGIHDLVGDLANLTGVPVKNLVREVKAILDTVTASPKDTTWNSLGDSLVESLQDETPLWGWFPSKKTTDKLYDSIVGGDEKYVERIKNSYGDEDKYHNAIRKALRDNDERIKEAAVADVEGDVEEYSRIINDIIDDGLFDKEDIYSAVKSEINELEPSEETEEADKEVSVYDAERYYQAIESGNATLVKEIKNDIIETHIANGKSKDDAEDAFKNSFALHLRNEYADGNITATKTQNYLVKYGGYESNDAYWKVKQFDYYKEHGNTEGYSKYTTYYEAVRSGRNLKSVTQEYLAHGVKKEDLASQITSYYKPLYKKMTQRERAAIKGYLLNAYVVLGYDREKKSKDIDKWLKD